MTAHWPHKALSICLLLATLSLTPLTPTTAQDELHFGDNITILIPTPDEYPRRLMDLELAPNSHFVAGYSAATTSSFAEAKGYLWRLASPPSNERLSIAESNLAITVADSRDESSRPYRIAISYDSQFVAIRAIDKLQIFQLPELSLYNSIVADEVFAWSENNQDILIANRHAVGLWNIHTDEVMQQEPSAYGIDCANIWPCFSLVQNINETWFLVPRSEIPDFLVCTPDLSNCNEHYAQQEINTDPIISSNGDMIVIPSGEKLTEITNLEIWNRIHKTDYDLSDTLPFDRYVCPCQISPNNQYIMISRSSRLQILRYPENNVLQEVEYSRLFAWMPDGEHFITYDARERLFSLYNVLRQEPIDTFNLNSLPDPISSHWSLEVSDEKLLMTSNDLVLLNLGLSGVIIPIERD